MKKQPIEIKLIPDEHAEPPKPEKVDKAFKYIGEWFIILSVLVGVYFLGRLLNIKLPPIELAPHQIVILAFCSAFVWVYVFKWGSILPFTCVVCMSGWFALILGYWSMGWFGVACMPISMTTAALYSEIRMRWL